MDIALSIAAFLFSITGIVGCIVPIIPGVALSYVGLLCASFCSYSEISSATLWIWLAVTVAVSVIDYFLPGYFARLVGGTRAGSIGATVGMIAGFFAGGLVGVILGPFFGAVIGELIHDRSDSAKAFRSGFPRLHRRYGIEARSRHLDDLPRLVGHLPCRKKLDRNNILKYKPYEKISVINRGNGLRAAYHGLYRFIRVHVRNGQERPAQDPYLHAG